MRGYGISGVLTFALVITTMPVRADTDIAVTYSHRLIAVGAPPDSAFAEGGIEATFTGAGPIDPAQPAPPLVPINDHTWVYTFAWDETGPVTIGFVDQAGDTTEVSAAPTAPMPLDPAEHGLPVVHLQTDLANLWDPEIGIYVWGEHDNCMQTGVLWERSATVDYYRDGTLEFSEPVGLRIHGHSSRAGEQKGFRLYFDDYGTQDDLVYDLFGSDPQVFQRLILRTGRWPSNLLYSNFAETLYRDLGHLTSRYTPLVVYLNDDCWGVYCLRERYDDEFIEETHGITGPYVLIKDSEAVTGDVEEWNSFLGYFSAPADYASHDWFRWVEDHLDLESYIDWLFINIFGATTDNGYSWNVAQLKVGGDPWQFLMWDEDGVLRDVNRDANHFLLYTAATEAEFVAAMPPEFSYPWWSPLIERWNAMFRHLMHNSEFKALFSHRLADLMEGPMAVPAMVARLDQLKVGQLPGLPFHAERWSYFSMNSYDSILESAKSFVTYRWAVVTLQLADFMESYRVPVELSRFAATSAAVTVSLDWHTESEENNEGFLLYRSQDSPDQMALIASYADEPALIGAGTTTEPSDYLFADATAPANHILYFQLRHVDTAGDTTTVNWLETAILGSFEELRLNELMADNENTAVDEFGEADDWFEIFNPTSVTIDLEGLYVTDDADLPTKHRLSAGLTVAPGEHLVLWADNQPEQGARHVAFRLSAGGEFLQLVALDGVTVIDQVQFTTQFADHVFQRFPDGTGSWSYGWDPTPATANTEPRIFEFLDLNETMSWNTATVPDEVGDYDPWLEIHNPLPWAVPLQGLVLSDQIDGSEGWELPGSSLGGGGHLLIWMDGEVGEGLFHASLGLETGGGFIGLFAPDQDVIDVETYPPLAADEAYARIPDGGDWQVTLLATPGAANPPTLAPLTLVINEFLALNDGVNQDEAGEYEDWVEIHNLGDVDLDLGGLYLTDDLAAPTQWAFPDTTLPAGGFLLVWCDDEPAQGRLHATFKLSGGGEEIGLFDRLDAGNLEIDSYVFGPQTTNVSEGRQPDGSETWAFFTIPTPGESNTGGIGVPPVPESRLALLPNTPNPFNPRTRLRFEVPASGRTRLRIYDARGRLAATPLDGMLTEGFHEIVWDGRDDTGRNLASGVYLVRLEFDGRVETRRLALVR